jgi:hypothetical protein
VVAVETLVLLEGLEQQVKEIMEGAQVAVRTPAAAVAAPAVLVKAMDNSTIPVVQACQTLLADQQSRTQPEEKAAETAAHQEQAQQTLEKAEMAERIARQLGALALLS